MLGERFLPWGTLIELSQGLGSDWRRRSAKAGKRKKQSIRVGSPPPSRSKKSKEEVAVSIGKVFSAVAADMQAAEVEPLDLDDTNRDAA